MPRSDMMVLWTDAYISDTRHLTAEQHGIYLLLMMVAWRTKNCCLPDNDRQLAQIVGLSHAKWKKNKPIVMDFWDLDNDLKIWTQKRLTLEWAKRQEFIASQSEKGKKSQARRRQEKTCAQSTKSLKNNNSTATNVSTKYQPAEAEADLYHSSLNEGEVKYQKRLMEAVGDSVEQDHSSIVCISVPLSWISGADACDVELDILPTLRRIADRRRNDHPIKSWGYFRDAVLEARNQRLSGLPAPILTKEKSHVNVSTTQYIKPRAKHSRQASIDKRHREARFSVLKEI